MTAPPGGPYGQDPHGQDPSGADPYGQSTYWAGQPTQGGQPPGAPYQNPQGGPYPYQQGDPYAAGPYPPQQYPQPGQQYPQPGQQYPQPGQQYPPGWPGGPYPPGPPPRGPRSKTPWLIGAGIAVLAVIALVVALVVVLGHNHKSTQAAPSATTTAAGPTSSQPSNSEQNATDCTPNVSGGEAPSGDTVSAGALSFPASAAPGWTPISDNSTPNAIGAVGLAQEVPGANQWMMQVEVAITNFVSSMDIATQASKLLTCMANGPGYANASPTLGPIKTSSLTVDGTDAARADADITIADPARNVKGDSVTVIAVKTTPVTFFFGASPIDDPGDRATIDNVITALKVTKS